jgi:hypothetical protein
MKWRRGKHGPDVIDRRSAGGARGGGLGGLPIPLGELHTRDSLSGDI